MTTTPTTDPLGPSAPFTVNGRTFQFRPAELSDLTGMLNCWFASFDTDPLFKVLLRSSDEEARLQRHTAEWTKGWNVSGRRNFVIVDVENG
jgi:hypothetical protein